MSKSKVIYCGAKSAFVPVIVVCMLDMIFSMIVLIVLAYLTYMLNNRQDLEKVVNRIDPQRTGNIANFLQQTSGEQVMMLTIPLVSNILGFMMAIFLLISAMKKYLNALRIWFILSIIFTIIQITIFITQITAGRNAAVFIVPGIFEYAYRFYALYVVRCFIKEVNSIKESTDSEDTAEVEA